MNKNEMSCILVDDEYHARELLRNMLNEIAPNLSILDECDDLPSAVKSINKYKPNIVFLDIEMPGHSGLELLEYFNEEDINFKIVFTTGYSEYAIQAFKLSATDYLLKPLDINALKDTIDRIEKNEQAQSLKSVFALKTNLSESQVNERTLAVTLNNFTKFIKLKDILMLQADGSYCKIFLSDNSHILASKNLKYFEEKLQVSNLFFRSHKSYIVNLKYVLEIQKSENELKLHGNVTGLISNDKFEAFMQEMEQLA